MVGTEYHPIFFGSIIETSQDLWKSCHDEHPANTPRSQPPPPTPTWYHCRTSEKLHPLVLSQSFKAACHCGKKAVSNTRATFSSGARSSQAKRLFTAFKSCMFFSHFQSIRRPTKTKKQTNKQASKQTNKQKKACTWLFFELSPVSRWWLVKRVTECWTYRDSEFTLNSWLLPDGLVVQKSYSMGHELHWGSQPGRFTPLLGFQHN